MVDNADIDRFICEVWERVLSDSAIHGHLLERLSWRNELRRLFRVLRAEVAKRESVG